ncbi:MAG TPA: GFA family protein [Stellaceae bacterium]
MADTYKGACFCGAVEFETSGKPNVAGYCHCKDCQAWSAGPINAFSLWPPASVVITKGADNVGTYNKTENSYRKFCKICGGHIMTDHPGLGMVDVYANLLQGFDHAPTLHVHYGSKMVSVKDGLPKFKDFPTSFGGSGEMLPD